MKHFFFAKKGAGQYKNLQFLVFPAPDLKKVKAKHSIGKMVAWLLLDWGGYERNFNFSVASKCRKIRLNVLQRLIIKTGVEKETD